ncbi:dTDP-D-glucose 4,6-dehydratase [Sporosarcina luteola]|nr:dTDP-D-glucose 4,6-dehydratase [Sporosarcina luteola]
MNLLITGGAGFIGSNFIQYILKKNREVNIINLDNLTYAGNLLSLKEVEKHPRYTFVQGSICELNIVQNTFEKYQIESVIHFAAESHVDNSIESPRAFLETNVMGTFYLLETARSFWMSELIKRAFKMPVSIIFPPMKCTDP